MFRKILIANRGEIACRVMRTATRMGIRTAAVYSEADRDALHVREADEAHFIGPAEAAQSYLKFETIVSIAKETEAEAIHPGYGFLSENADFAEACAKAGIAFIGPSPAAIRAMGDKAAAKAIMEKAGVPVVPGYHGKKQDRATLLKAAAEIGFPVLLKATAGGGGKGMRIVRGQKEFDDALASAKREAKAAFGDDRMLVEKYIERPRHIEVQVFGDSHGNVVHLFERDCSVQRRHQKVIEEAPAPGVDEAWRARICDAAVAAARAVDYAGAGTVEFIVESGPRGKPGDFFFMEMNTRLQVEHPVTEMITGTDLVEWQLRVAAGEGLPLKQDEIAMNGHAIEARVYAEDPAKDFLPSPGRVFYAEYPYDNGEIRVDGSEIDNGAAVPPEYDPMIAKVIARGDDREAAIGNLHRELGKVRIIGVATNTAFLSNILCSKVFAVGAVDTAFIDRNIEDLLPSLEGTPPQVLALACLGMLNDFRRLAKERAQISGDPWSPWARAGSWRLNDLGNTVLRFICDGQETDVRCRALGDRFVMELPGGDMSGTYRPSTPRYEDDEMILGETVIAEVEGEDDAGMVFRDGSDLHVFYAGQSWRLGIHDPLAAAEAHEGASGGLTAPMPGKVAAVHVKAGQKVKVGQPLIVVEAMKMEHAINAPADGKVAEVRFKAGDQVQEGEVLVVVKEAG